MDRRAGIAIRAHRHRKEHQQQNRGQQHPPRFLEQDQHPRAKDQKSGSDEQRQRHQRLNDQVDPLPDVQTTITVRQQALAHFRHDRITFAFDHQVRLEFISHWLYYTATNLTPDPLSLGVEVRSRDVS